MFPSSTRDIPASSAVPRHVAIIMDGNGRWAKQRMLPRVAGHRRGVEAGARDHPRVHRARHRVPHAVRVLERELAAPARRDLDPDGPLPARAGAGSREAPRQRHPVQGGRRHCRCSTGASASSSRPARRRRPRNTRLTLTVAANYGGRWDIAQAARRYFAIHPEAVRDGSELRPEALEPFLAMAYAPEPDLFIRTGGEQRISNFLLWQLAYTELYFTDMLWPDFDADRAQRRDRVVSAARAPLRPDERAGAGGAASASRLTRLLARSAARLPRCSPRAS